MHWLDRAAALSAQRTPPSEQVFNLGWGDLEVIDWYRENAGVVPAVAEIEVTLRPARRSGTTVVRDLAFDSPFERLPERVRPVRGRWITSTDDTDRVVILQAAWNDEDFRTRTRFARDLLEHGIGSVMLEYPFYGARRRAPELETPVPLVSDFCLMGRGGVLEGRSMARHLQRLGHRVGVAGYSMGGNIAGFVGMLAGFPMAISAAAASYAAGPPFMSGLLRSTIAWDALGGDTPAVADRLSAILHAGSLLNHPAPPHTAAATLVAGTKDGFVPTAAVQAVHRHWPGSTLEWIKAGHASLLFTKRDRIVAAIADSFTRLDAMAAAR